MCGKNTGASVQGNPVSDQDQACNSHPASHEVSSDPDESCGKATDPGTGAIDADQACDDGNWTSTDPDQNCHKAPGSHDKDESCTHSVEGSADEACGYYKEGQRDRDQHCGIGTDSDDTYVS
jgi:hypothetical protein